MDNYLKGAKNSSPEIIVAIFMNQTVYAHNNRGNNNAEKKYGKESK